jgi:hypothetical protein
VTSRHRDGRGVRGSPHPALLFPTEPTASEAIPLGIDFHLISNFAALALITLAGPAVVFILYFRRGAL